MKTKLLLFIMTLFVTGSVVAQDPSSSFTWPDGKRAAVSLSFDDARLSQIDVGIPLLNKYGIKASFYVSPANLEQRIDAWKEAVASGHEIGNHSFHHPCSGNFAWARERALENYSLDSMRKELGEAGRFIFSTVGVIPKTFAYPCGQTFVGRGVQTRSYVPLVAELFLAGRGWLDEGPNDPAFCDLSQLMGTEMDGLDFEDILPMLERAKSSGQWIVFAGHEIGNSGYQTTRVEMLEKLIRYAGNPFNHIWLAPVGTVAQHVDAQRRESSDSVRE